MTEYHIDPIIASLSHFSDHAIVSMPSVTFTLDTYTVNSVKYSHGATTTVLTKNNLYYYNNGS